MRIAIEPQQGATIYSGNADQRKLPAGTARFAMGFAIKSADVDSALHAFKCIRERRETRLASVGVHVAGVEMGV